MVSYRNFLYACTKLLLLKTPSENNPRSTGLSNDIYVCEQILFCYENPANEQPTCLNTPLAMAFSKTVTGESSSEEPEVRHGSIVDFVNSYYLKALQARKAKAAGSNDEFQIEEKLFYDPHKVRYEFPIDSSSDGHVKDESPDQPSSSPDHPAAPSSPDSFLSRAWSYAPGFILNPIMAVASGIHTIRLTVESEGERIHRSYLRPFQVIFFLAILAYGIDRHRLQKYERKHGVVAILVDLLPTRPRDDDSFIQQLRYKLVSLAHRAALNLSMLVHLTFMAGDDIVTWVKTTSASEKLAVTGTGLDKISDGIGNLVDAISAYRGRSPQKLFVKACFWLSVGSIAYQGASQTWTWGSILADDLYHGLPGRADVMRKAWDVVHPKPIVTIRAATVTATRSSTSSVTVTQTATVTIKQYCALHTLGSTVVAGQVNGTAVSEVRSGGACGAFCPFCWQRHCCEHALH